MRLKFFLVILTGFSFFVAKPADGQSVLTYTNSKSEIVPVKTLFDWQIKRRQILDSMQALFGKLPEDPDRPPFSAKTPALPPFNTEYIDEKEKMLQLICTYL